MRNFVNFIRRAADGVFGNITAEANYKLIVCVTQSMSFEHCRSICGIPVQLPYFAINALTFESLKLN